jgi:hypothetical protein
MAERKRLSIELLDIVEHSRPGLLDMRPRETARYLDSRDKAFMSYDEVFATAGK